MKTTTTLVLLIAIATGATAQTQLFRAYLDDPDTKQPTNIRKTPGGAVERTINQADDVAYFISLSESKNGWFKIAELSGTETDLNLKDNVGWIHGSVLRCDTRNYGGEILNLYAEPSTTAKVVGTIKEESGVRPRAMKGDWVKVKYKGIEGWIEAEWLCDSPLTTCS